MRGVGADVVAVSGDPATVAARLNRSPAVLYAEPDYIARASAIPDDPRFGELYGLHNTGQFGGSNDADIDAPEEWDVDDLGPAGRDPQFGLGRVNLAKAVTG